MKKIFIYLSMLAIGAMGAQANIMPNGGFEDGVTTPWAVGSGAALSISTLLTRDGTYSGQVDFPAAINANILQGFFFAAEHRLKTFTLSYSVNTEATGYTGDLGIWLALGEWNQSIPIAYQYATVQTHVGGTAGWVTYSYDFTLTQADGTYLKPIVYFQPGAAGAGSVLIDNITLEEKVDDPNLLSNGGFEDRTASVTPWVAGAGGAVSITNDARSGSLSAKFDFPTAGGSSIVQEFAITSADATNTYTLSYSVKAEGYSEALKIWPVVGEKTGAAYVWHNGVYQLMETDGWVTYRDDIVMTQAAADHFYVGLRFYPQTGVAGSVLIDDVSLELKVDDPNLVVNGGFEDRTASATPWVAAAGAAVSVTNEAFSGGLSAKVDFPTADLANIYQGFFFAEEDHLKTFTFSFSVNVEATGHSTILGIRPALGEWNQVDSMTYQYGDTEWVPAGTTGWVTFSQDFTLSQTDGTYLQPKLYFYPSGTAGSVLLDEIRLEIDDAIIVEPFPAIADFNLLVNSGFSQVTNENPVGGGWYTVNGSLSDWSGFWGKSADLIGWSHYHADPNNLGLLIGNTNSGPDAAFVLDGTDKFNTDFNTTDGILNLNSSGEYRNGMMQTLSGVTIDSALTYDLTVDVKKTASHDHTSSTFTMALTSGSGTDATNLANAVTGGLLQVPVTNLTDSFTSQKLQISGAALTGTLNVLIENLNTETANSTPLDADNVSQVTIGGISLGYLGDLNEDGLVNWHDKLLIDSYLDGSVDGGDDAATRIAARMALGDTTAEALAYLNLIGFDVDGDGQFDADDVTAVETAIPSVLIVIDGAAFDGSGDVEVDISGLIAGKTYKLWRETDLTADPSFTNMVNSAPAGSGANTLSDPNPPTGQAFYKVSD